MAIKELWILGGVWTIFGRLKALSLLILTEKLFGFIKSTQFSSIAPLIAVLIGGRTWVTSLGVIAFFNRLFLAILEFFYWSLSDFLAALLALWCDLLFSLALLKLDATWTTLPPLRDLRLLKPSFDDVIFRMITSLDARLENSVKSSAQVTRISSSLSTLSTVILGIPYSIYVVLPIESTYVVSRVSLIWLYYTVGFNTLF